jgi:alkylation response protein AidB-like acyl-CoA dehydrogenase
VTAEGFVFGRDRGAADSLLDAVTRFVDEEALPAVAAYDREDAYPEPLVQRMCELGLFGTAIGEEHGGLGLDLVTYAEVVAEVSRAWISLSGVMNTHFMAAWMLQRFGTREQRDRLLPRMATGELRGAFSITEPHAGSDVQAIRVRATRDGDEYVVDGHKKWITNGLRAGVVMLLAVTDPDARPRHRGFTCLVVEKEPMRHELPGLTIPPLLRKLGSLGIDSTEMLWDGFRTPASSVLGGPDGVGRGFKQFMAALELGRVNVAARGLGLARSAFDHAISYASEREAFGAPIAQHQSIQIKLAQMATKIRATELLVRDAAQRKQAGERADLQAGMAKLFATETAEECALDAMRIHGGAGFSRDNPVERLYRDAPLLILGEGSNEIQHLIIARRLLELRRA